MWLPELLGKEGNSLLKIIEEPPENTIFIFVTEQPDKILNTIKSRTQIIQFSGVEDDDIVKYLVENGADIEVKSTNVDTPLSTAAHFGHSEIVDYLIENGADCNIIINPLWSEAIISTIKFGRYLQVLCSQNTFPDLDLALQELFEELINQEAWQQFALTTVKSYGLKVGISNLIIEKLTTSSLPNNFRKLLIAELKDYIDQVNYDLETFESGLLYEKGLIPSPIPFNSINGNDEIIAKSLDNSALKTIINFYDIFPHYKVPGNYIAELAQGDVDNVIPSLVSLMLILNFYKEVAESLLKQYIPANVRKALSCALKACEDHGLEAVDVTESVEIDLMNIDYDNTTQEQNYESKTTGDINSDPNLDLL